MSLILFKYMTSCVLLCKLHFSSSVLLTADTSLLSLSMALVESIPQHVKYKGNVTFGIPLEQVWKHLISIATHKVEVASFYWTLTGEDINVNSSSDTPVSCL